MRPHGIQAGETKAIGDFTLSRDNAAPACFGVKELGYLLLTFRWG
jgi:hypothetical protein